MKFKFTVVFVLITQVFFAQIGTEKTWEANGIKTVAIAGQNVFKIKVSNTRSNTVELKVKIEGEYAKHVVILDSFSNETLSISASFQPLFKDDNDKLSAHKVLSVEYELTVPKRMALDIKSDIASVKVIGAYHSVFIELHQGNCNLKDFLGDATVNTIDGNIAIQTNNAKVEAFSKTGTIQNKQFKYGKYNISCHTINGDINVTKIEK
ncbi:hypothetical protein [Psychroserpens sp. NJDZ02]|uniref:hypothetical protein n=1 Tax=Psychroserpens sp. NJDZ02 TaxID=2570561 RepID=UPI0010A889EC|nr:hypothetical protein [Psychroserpens sp. NJDZ02]QCE41422.1 hypothetical protein E9099_08340 [Psychroserpens sp. NJDZ02]